MACWYRWIRSRRPGKDAVCDLELMDLQEMKDQMARRQPPPRFENLHVAMQALAGEWDGLRAERVSYCSGTGGISDFSLDAHLIRITELFKHMNSDLSQYADEKGQ